MMRQKYQTIKSKSVSAVHAICQFFCWFCLPQNLFTGKIRKACSWNAKIAGAKTKVSSCDFRRKPIHWLCPTTVDLASKDLDILGCKLEPAKNLEFDPQHMAQASCSRTAMYFWKQRHWYLAGSRPGAARGFRKRLAKAVRSSRAVSSSCLERSGQKCVKLCVRCGFCVFVGACLMDMPCVAGWIVPN